MTKPLISENHAKAPLCAAFVQAMREAFGKENVILLYVKENGFVYERR